MGVDSSAELPGKSAASGAGGRLLKTQVSRRRFLGRGTETAFGVAATALALKEAGDLGVAADRKSKTLGDAIKGLFKGQDQPETVADKVVETTVQKPSTEFDLVYPNLSGETRQAALDAVFEAQEVMLPNILPNLERIKSYELLIRESAKAAQVPENLLLGLVIAESQGDPEAVSPVGAKGLTQMMDAMAQKYNLKISDGEDDERLMPEKILPASAKELKEAHDLRYGDWGLAFWEWHVGAPQVHEALKVYFSEKYQEELEDINVKPANDSAEAESTATAEAIRRIAINKAKIQGRVNLADLFQNQTVAGMFTGEGWNKTDEYVSRIVASSIIYNANKHLV